MFSLTFLRQLCCKTVPRGHTFPMAAQISSLRGRNTGCWVFAFIGRCTFSLMKLVRDYLHDDHCAAATFAYTRPDSHPFKGNLLPRLWRGIISNRPLLVVASATTYYHIERPLKCCKDIPIPFSLLALFHNRRNCPYTCIGRRIAIA